MGRVAELRSFGYQSMARDLVIDEPTGERFGLALDELVAGRSFIFLDSNLSIYEGSLQVLVPSQWDTPSINEERALEDLRRADRNIAELASLSPQFAAIIKGLGRVFILVYDYGTAGIHVAELRDGRFAWYPGFPK